MCFYLGATYYLNGDRVIPVCNVTFQGTVSVTNNVNVIFCAADYAVRTFFTINLKKKQIYDLQSKA
jgi:hypothetical protein